MMKKLDIIKHEDILMILILRLFIVFIGLIVVIIAVIRAFDPKQSTEEFVIIMFVIISILLIEKFIDHKSRISNIKGIKIPRFGMSDKEIIIGEDIIPVELKSINPYRGGTFEILMELEFSENPTIYLYVTKDRKIISEYSGILKDKCDLFVSIKQEEILNFKLDKIGIIRNLFITEIYEPYKSK